MPQWVKLCPLSKAPAPNQVCEVEIEQAEICLANINGELSAIDNICPHRQGPLGQGWIEGDTVFCPWHSWSFNVKTGNSTYPENEKVATFPLRIEGDDVLIEID